MNTYGNATAPVIFLTMEAHKLHREFDIAADVFKGQAVKLNATGSVVPIAANDTGKDRIGVSIHTRKTAGEPFPYGGSVRVTVAMRGYTTIQAQAGAALIPGPVKYSGMSATDAAGNAYPQYIQSAGGDAECEGWAMNVATAQGQVVEVVLR